MSFAEIGTYIGFLRDETVLPTVRDDGEHVQMRGCEIATGFF